MRSYQLDGHIIVPEQNLVQKGKEVKHLDHKSMQVLLVLIEFAGQQVSKRTLIDSVWKDKSVTDDILSVAISSIRKALGDKAREPKFIKTLPGFGYCLIAPVVEIEEQNAHGAREKLVSKLNIKWALVTLVLLVVVASTALFITPPNPPSANTQAEFNVRDIAILPFNHIGDDQANSYLTDGLPDVILDRLLGIPNLKVVDRFSSFVFRNTDTPLVDIGEQLGVNHIVRGSIQSAQGQTRVALQLIHVNSGKQIWSQIFDRQNSEIFSLQDDISLALVSAISPDYVGQLPESPKVSEQVRELYSLGDFHASQRTSESLTKAVDYFEKAIAEEPLYAEAHLGLAKAFLFQNSYGGWNLEKAMTAAWPELRRAIELAPNMSEAHAFMGLMQTDEAFFEIDNPNRSQMFEQAELSFKKAIALGADDVTTYHWYARLLWAMDKHVLADEYFQLAEERNPLSPALLRMWAVNLVSLDKADSAQRAYAKANDLATNLHITEIDNIQVFRLNRDKASRLLNWIDTEPEAARLDDYFLNPVHITLVKKSANQMEYADHWQAYSSKLRVPWPGQREWLAIVDAGVNREQHKVAELLEALNRSYPSNLQYKSNLAKALIHVAEFDNARDLLLEMHPQWKDSNATNQNVENLNADNYRNWFYYALSILTDKPDEARDRLLTLLQFLQSGAIYDTAVALMTKAEIYAQMGNKREALTYVELAIDAGWHQDLTKDWWLLANSPMLQLLHENERFKQLVLQQFDYSLNKEL